MRTLLSSTLLALFCISFSTYSFAQRNESTSSDSKKKQLKNQTDSARVYIAFCVEKDGSITNVKVKKIECPKCDKTFKESLKSESVRVIKNMPKLKESDERRYFLQPIKFKIED